ncbi:hypothetical protein Btru_004743 [Bulinus truncatus]|nr:hypothetical protein Btru_004743 [Bulinus truncatus]
MYETVSACVSSVDKTQDKSVYLFVSQCFPDPTPAYLMTVDLVVRDVVRPSGLLRARATIREQRLSSLDKCRSQSAKFVYKNGLNTIVIFQECFQSNNTCIHSVIRVVSDKKKQEADSLHGPIAKRRNADEMALKMMRVMRTAFVPGGRTTSTDA